MNTLTYVRSYYSYYNFLQWVQEGLSVVILGFRNVYMGVPWLLNGRVDFPTIHHFISLVKKEENI